MMGTESLMALAILISHSGALDTTAVQAQLTQQEQTQVQAYVVAEEKLPGSLENLLQQTQLKIQAGELQDAASHGSPTEMC